MIRKAMMICLIVYVFYGVSSYAGKLNQYDEAELPTQMQSAAKGDALAALWISHFYKKNGDLNNAKVWLYQAARLGSAAAIVEYGYDKPYIAMSNMACGELKVEVTTTCARIDRFEERPLCYAQHFTFHIKDKDNVREMFLFNSKYDTDLTLAIQSRCIFDGQRYWFAIESGNFGSGRTCEDCERTDFIDDTGTYVGSTKSAIGKRIVDHYKRVSPSIERKLNQIDFDIRFNIAVKKIQTYPTIE